MTREEAKKILDTMQPAGTMGFKEAIDVLRQPMRHREEQISEVQEILQNKLKQYGLKLVIKHRFSIDYLRDIVNQMDANNEKEIILTNQGGIYFEEVNKKE